MWTIRENNCDNSGNIVGECEFLYHITSVNNIKNIQQHGLLRKIGMNRQRCGMDNCEDERVFLTNYDNINNWKEILYEKEKVAIFKVKQSDIYLYPYLFSWFHYSDGGNEVSVYNRDIEICDIVLYDFIEKSENTRDFSHGMNRLYVC